MNAGIIHPMAWVGDDVTIGAGTRVWQFASVIRGAAIGADCTISPATLIDGPLIGDRCKIQSFAAIGPGAVLGNDVFIGPHVILCNDMWPSTRAEGFDLEALRGKSSVVVRDGASVGAHVIMLPGFTIGAGALIGAGAVVDRNVPDGHLLRRDGTLIPIAAKLPERMRFTHE